MIAKLFTPGKVDLEATVVLNAEPNPGDALIIKDGTEVRVIRRTLVDRSEGSTFAHDIELEVRLRT